ncbi:MAG TPA: site-specific DNA-methyltransferase [Candidatus Limnocylindrales bacterium]|nr:site-specific DNA-methyltransferase [Candidatus Limnocylindrales bacterium]
MAERKKRLELTWIGKEERPRLEPRILLETTSLSYHAAKRATEHDSFENLLIHGDNLLALKALEQQFTGKIKCIYIDPPYNTGSAFEHYDDGLEHSLWLSLMRDRLELLRLLLTEDGVLFSSIDDSEVAYLTILLDEVFGRKNGCGQFVWEKKKKPSFLNASMGVVTEYVLAYAKDRTKSPPFIGGLTTAGKKYPLNNAGNGVKVLTFPSGAVVFRCVDQVFEPQDMSEGKIVTRLLDRLEVRDGRNVGIFRLEGEWRYSQSRVDEIIAEGETLVISKSPFRPNHVKDGGEPKKLKNLLSVAHYEMSTYEDATAESIALFGDAAFDYPKPEKLISTLIDAVTNPGDWVLDSFAGSGTTGAVAHKMGRRWIMVELGEHCLTHVLPRLKQVIDGADPGGVTEATGWRGGGGFRCYRLAPSLLEKDKWGNWIVSRAYHPEMLAEAMCKLEGFHYAPEPEVFWNHGRSTENDFIYVTTQNLSREQLRFISDQVGRERTLLICCSAFRAKKDEFPNLTVRKIPQAVLSACEWGRDDYSLNVEQLPPVQVVEEAKVEARMNAGANGEATSRKSEGRRKKGHAVQDLPLFAGLGNGEGHR